MACLAVIDVETTGLNPYRHDRIVELAALLISSDGTILREFVSLVNPERDIGPTSIHGLTTKDVIFAPTFKEIAGLLIEVIDGCVAIAGHNVRFDCSFLSAEFDRIGYSLPEIPTVCTMQLAGGGSLSCNCSDYGIDFEGDMHSARNDANATARLLSALINDAPSLKAKLFYTEPISWPKIPKTPVALLTRDDMKMLQIKPPTYLEKLLTRVMSDLPSNNNEESSICAYTALLDRVLEDGQIDKGEGDALIELAIKGAISGEKICEVHKDYMSKLCSAALQDNVLTEGEYRYLSQVAILLGIDSQNLEHIFKIAEHQSLEEKKSFSALRGANDQKQLIGKSVCFTGECQCCLNDKTITRDMATGIALRKGMVVVESVTKKLDILVVADPLTQSGKARKARRYGIRIIHEPVFWGILGLEVR